VQNVRFIRDYAALVQPKYDWSRTYAQTKLRALITSGALAERWKNAGITVNSLHPGVVDTGLISAMDSTFIKSAFGFAKHFFMSPEKGARTSIFPASDPSIGDITGHYFVKCKSVSYNSIADDVATRSFLWSESVRFLAEAGIDGEALAGLQLPTSHTVQ
jgi:NAD(P)-dependent dehydrogenase (short-subunit alcohol dehydrogenase family)